MNQIGIANVMMHLNMTKASTVDGDMVRHMILNSLRMYRERFHDEYGEMVICYDSKHYWRRDYFPQYKMNRKKVRDDSSHDWNNIFECWLKDKHQHKQENLVLRTFLTLKTTLWTGQWNSNEQQKFKGLTLKNEWEILGKGQKKVQYTRTFEKNYKFPKNSEA